MGYGLPAAIGAKVANPDKNVIVFMGDGGFQMNIQELGTILQSKIGVKMVLLNNSWLGMVRQWQELFYDKRYSFTHLANPDFQKIAQGFIMNDILGRANHYLKKMSKRYLLESQNGSLNIIIRDLEQGGVPRSTSTISGGESFIISLALALGLSSLDSERVSADILFIDEGFGSLSDDHLNTVMDTLQRLHESSGKRIGIISHIDQLRTRIGVKIQLNKISQTTSTINIQNGGGL